MNRNETASGRPNSADYHRRMFSAAGTPGTEPKRPRQGLGFQRRPNQLGRKKESVRRTLPERPSPAGPNDKARWEENGGGPNGQAAADPTIAEWQKDDELRRKPVLRQAATTRPVKVRDKGDHPDPVKFLPSFIRGLVVDG